MRVYELVSAERKAEMLSHLLMLSRTRLREKTWRRVRSSQNTQSGPDHQYSSIWLHSLSRQLHAISQTLDLTIGGAFKLFGYSLESIRGLDFLLNGTRTRLIENYPFYRDRPVDLPEYLGDASSLRQNSFLSELVRSWRRDVPIRAVHGPHWSQRRILYAQVGTNDGMGLPRIPPGSVVAIGEIKEDERNKPNPERYYFLQHRTGYSCCRCTVEGRRLLLITEGQGVGTRQEFAYPGEVRIVGRIVSFATRLPIPKREPIPSQTARDNTPLLLPWEHTSFSDLLRAERLRFDITEAHLNRVADALEEHLGVRLSARTLRRYEHNAQQLPRTAILLAIMAMYSLRPSDVLRLLQLWPAGARQLSLTTMLRASKPAELPSMFDPAPVPEPAAQWQELLEEWGQWPSLLSMTFPHLASQSDGILRLNRSRRFRGLDPLVSGGSVVFFDEQDISPPRNGNWEREGWNRPMYVLRHSGEASCGYLEASATHFALQPHPASGVPRLIFPHGQVQISGRVTAVASLL